MSERLSEAFLEAYFKNIAVALKDLAHEDTDNGKAFYRMADANDLEEFDNAVRNMRKSACLLLEIGSGSIGDWDSQRDMPRIGLHCLVKTSTDGFSDLNASRDQAKNILLKIVSRMRIDCKTEHERTDNTIGPLKALTVVFDSHIKFSNMTAIDGNWYGKSFYFDFKAPINLVYDTNDWTS